MTTEKPLLEITSLKYKRRLVKALNSTLDGFFHNAIRYHRARVNMARQLQVRDYYSKWRNAIPGEGFYDVTNTAIIVSRKP